MASAHTPFRDPARTFTPLGRPFRKPRKVVTSLASLASSSDIDEYYFLERPQIRPKPHIGICESRESRPPLQVTAVGPTPCTYSLPQPPRTTVGGKINPRTKYDRDALPTPNHEVWTLKATVREKTPSPCSYAVVGGMGNKSPNKKMRPSYSIGGRPAPKKTINYPAPNVYNAAQSADHISRHFPSFSIAMPKNSRKTESSPGPAHYHPKHSFCQHRQPSYTIRTRTATV